MTRRRIDQTSAPPSLSVVWTLTLWTTVRAIYRPPAIATQTITRNVKRGPKPIPPWRDFAWDLLYESLYAREGKPVHGSAGHRLLWLFMENITVLVLADPAAPALAKLDAIGPGVTSASERPRRLWAMRSRRPAFCSTGPARSPKCGGLWNWRRASNGSIPSMRVWSAPCFRSWWPVRFR